MNTFDKFMGMLPWMKEIATIYNNKNTGFEQIAERFDYLFDFDESTYNVALARILERDNLKAPSFAVKQMMESLVRGNKPVEGISDTYKPQISFGPIKVVFYEEEDRIGFHSNLFFIGESAKLCNLDDYINDLVDMCSTMNLKWNEKDLTKKYSNLKKQLSACQSLATKVKNSYPERGFGGDQKGFNSQSRCIDNIAVIKNKVRELNKAYDEIDICKESIVRSAKYILAHDNDYKIKRAAENSLDRWDSKEINQEFEAIKYDIADILSSIRFMIRNDKYLKNVCNL